MPPSFLTHVLHAAILLRVATSAHTENTPVIDVGYAQYEGVVDTSLNITAFLGMRYAAPPTGNLRWQPPARPARVAHVQPANSNPPRCYQGTFGASSNTPLAARDGDTQSEDCLFLSVYSPALDSTEPLPTIVWIHGGGYAFGSASEYNGSDLVQESDNQVVVVVIQYRLGLFGFLAGQQVKDGGALNAGLLDQDFALRWVNKNVHSLSGDPNKVTIWGESAGAGSVIQHMIARNGSTRPKLFGTAITSSTFLPSQYRYNDATPQTLFNNVSSQAGCAASAVPLDCLRAADSALLQDINLSMGIAGFMGTFAFVPVVDGSFILQSPTDALRQGNLNGDILLSFTNSHEGNLFVNQSAKYDVETYVKQLFPLFGPEQTAAAASVYRPLGSALDQVNAIMGESIFICPTYRLLQAFPGQSYKGEYAVPPGLHADDLFYYFPSYKLPGLSRDFNNTDFMRAFTQSFLASAISGDPNAKFDKTNITPPWRKWSTSAEVEMVFDKTEADAPLIKPASTPGALMRRCQFWYGVRALTAQ
ncbi:Alpha/Beta hydrolase protein [Mycena sp. CBHHK59/15]|nr:Alpha/Beta hydrolase protein [Mycena sp. CBHHK59/15]